MTVHALSVDLEDEESGLVLAATGRVIPPTDRVILNAERLLRLFDEFGFKATWFVLGEVAEHYPELIRRLTSQGHEIGIHGYHHHHLYELNAENLRNSLSRAKAVVEDLSGLCVRGHRAAAMSLTKATWWALEVLAETGFDYDSSLYPFQRNKRYGVAGAPMAIHEIQLATGRRIIEIPLSVVSIAGMRIPVCGGGYLRHFPLSITRWALRWLERVPRPAVVYLHPYEVDPDARGRRIAADLSPDELKRLKGMVKGQYRNREKTINRLRSLFETHRFAPLEHVFQNELDRAAACTRDGKAVVPECPR